MEILFISDLCSQRMVDSIFVKTNCDPGFAVQKFNRLLCKGFIANGCKVVALTNPPVNKSYSRNKWISIKNETEENIVYKYISFPCFPILKHLFVFISTFFHALVWGLSDKKEKTVICDVLKISGCMGALAASFFIGVKAVGVVTDIYNLMSAGNSSFKVKLAGKLNSWYVSRYDYYVLLTEQMNCVVNPKGKPHIVMEALCDNTVTDVQINIAVKSKPKTILYAGGLYEKYGLKMLVDGFISLNREDVRLVLYGSGSFVHELKQLCEIHSNIDYRGVASNSEVVQSEIEATLLVNPRFSTEEFTKYSFPSKNMEYMTTGTPLLTTELPGMPEEYHQHVFLFDKETPEGYSDSMARVLDLDESELNDKGKSAREFVLHHKNNVHQTNRIINLITAC